MTELEQKIYACALKVMPKAIERVNKIETNARYIEIPFICDGCMDRLIFDRDVGMFTKIRYAKGKGDGMSIGRAGLFSGYFKDVDYCEINITI